MRDFRAAITGAVLLLAFTAATAGVTVQAECEEFTDSYNIGGEAIIKSFCSGASEYYATDGLDISGEWIEVAVAVPITGYYQPRIGYQVAYDDSAAVRLTILDEETPEVNRVSDFQLLEGWGFG